MKKPKIYDAQNLKAPTKNEVQRLLNEKGIKSPKIDNLVQIDSRTWVQMPIGANRVEFIEKMRKKFEPVKNLAWNSKKSK